MNTRLQAIVRFTIVLALALAWPAASFAQVKVIVSGGFRVAYQELLPEFERTTGIKVTTGSGPSQGNSPDAIPAQIRRGVPADAVLMSREGLDELIAENRILYVDRVSPLVTACHVPFVLATILNGVEGSKTSGGFR